MRKFLLLICIALAGCSSIKELPASSSTFLACKAADLGTTYYGLHHGFHEINPLSKALLAHGWIPLIAVSVGLYLLIDHLNEPALTVPVNVLTCGVAARNLVLVK